MEGTHIIFMEQLKGKRLNEKERKNNKENEKRQQRRRNKMIPFNVMQWVELSPRGSRRVITHLYFNFQDD